MRRRVLLLLLAASPAAAQAPRPGSAPPPPLTVFAAASLADALRAIEAEWRAAAPGRPAVRFSFAASSTLARQIEQGAPADLFAAADEAWMDYLAQHNAILPDTRISPLGNDLVLVAPAATAPPPFTLSPATDLAALLGPRGRLATGDPAHVPAGRYAQQALTSLGFWTTLEPRLARADNVRAALLLVERGEAPLGIVYRTDAQASRGVRVLATFPPGSHPPVTYPFALTRRAAEDPAARALLVHLAGAEAAPTWRRLGFTLRAD